jgi:hypothetical protein
MNINIKGVIASLMLVFVLAGDDGWSIKIRGGS